jgi:hypothetical protein
LFGQTDQPRPRTSGIPFGDVLETFIRNNAFTIDTYRRVAFEIKENL